ncbi:MAG: hypothetical protein HKP03_03270 [Xanthomonadales bacterium]|nr:hypothetical protein [Xanthomonadales bacterium]
MKTASMKYLLGAIVLLALLLPLGAAAADDPPPLAEEWLVTVKQGHMSDFLAAVKAHGEFRAGNGDSRDWQIYTASLADGLNQVSIRYCCFDWSDQDAYDEWARANPQVLEHWMSTADPHIEKIEHYFEEMDWTNSHWNEGEYRFYTVRTFELKSGHEGDFDTARDTMSQIAINQGWANESRSWIWGTMIGGSQSVYVVVPHKNYASIGSGDDSFTRFLGEKLGSEEAARELMKQFSASTWSSSLQLWEHHPGLSMQSSD